MWCSGNKLKRMKKKRKEIKREEQNDKIVAERHSFFAQDETPAPTK
jgi:hypothetical protein